MIDLILAAAMGAAFYGGFRAGNQFKSLKDLAAAALAVFSK